MRRALFALLLLVGSACAQNISVVSTTPTAQQATFTTVNPLILNDANGGHWKVTMNDSGILVTSSTSQTTSTVYQIDSATDQTTWTIGISTSGLLTTTKAASFSPLIVSTYPFLSTGGRSSVLWTAGGILKTNTPQ